jgi:hypothetical protein
MPNQAEIHARERADRALRGGRPAEALAHYAQLLAGVRADRAHYEAWLEGAVAAYLALGRTREAGYGLLALRRYAEAQRHFPPAERPLEWALASSRLGHHGDAARLLSEHGHPALAAIELEAAGANSAARLEWERVLRDPRLAGRPYETALAHFNLAEALLRIGDRAAASRQFSTAQRLLEEVADEFETRGELQRAFDCYSVLLRLGRDTGSFENVSEGYLNAIRIVAAGEDRYRVVQYHDDFVGYAVERGEWHAAALAARQAADYSLRAGLPYDRHYLSRAVEAWTRAAHENQKAGGPVDLTANALHAAIDASTALGDLAACGRFYGELAALPLADKRRARYQALAQRYAALPAEAQPAAVAFPEHLRNPDIYQDIWRQDLVEWELGGDPAAVLVRLVVERPSSEYSRQALRALLLCSAPGFSAESPAALAELAVALGHVCYYDALSPLERLYDHPAPEVRAAVMRGVGEVCVRRSFGLVRRGLADPAPRVAQEALSALRRLKFVDGLDALVRIFREAADERVRLAALETIGGIGTPAAALVLIEAVRQETGAVRDAAETRLGQLSGEEVAALIRQSRDAEVGERREALDRALRTLR